MVRTSRTLRASDITITKIKALRNLREEEDAHTDPSESPTIDPKNWPKTLEAVGEWIGQHLGVKKSPLSYVIRREIDPPPF